MKGFIAKSALTALLEKVWLASGNSIKRLDVKFAGASAGIRFERQYGVLSATVILPAIDETATVSQGFFNDLIGYVLHELGHAWFTDNEPWDDAVREHGKVLGSIVNALEDCREEDKVIRSGYADNARALFVQLANNVFKDGFDNTMIENVAAVIAVEGRRLNGYELIVPDLFSGCPWAEEIADALSDSRHCNSTADVVAVAVALWEKIKPQGEDEGKGGDGDEQDGDDGQPDDGDEGQDGQPDDGQDGQDGDEGQDSDKPSDKPSDKDGDKDGDKPSDEPSDKPSDEPDSPDKDDEEGEAGGKGNGTGAVQNIDGADLIIEQAREVSEDNVFGLPLRGKVIVGTINWR
jgi:hypothetical protein